MRRLALALALVALSGCTSPTKRFMGTADRGWREEICGPGNIDLQAGDIGRVDGQCMVVIHAPKRDLEGQF